MTVVVQCAESGENALEICKSGIDVPDAIIIDEFMPAGGKLLGHEVVQQLRTLPAFRRVVIIGCTDKAEEAARLFMDSGADAVWIKPMPLRQEALVQVLELRDFLLVQDWKNSIALGAGCVEGGGWGLGGAGEASRDGHSYGDIMKLSMIRKLSLRARERENEWSHVRRMGGNGAGLGGEEGDGMEGLEEMNRGKGQDEANAEQMDDFDEEEEGEDDEDEEDEEEEEDEIEGLEPKRMRTLRGESD